MSADDGRVLTTGDRSGLQRLEVRWLGIMPYADALDHQRSQVTARQAGEVSDQLLLVEHPAVITVGVSGRGTRFHLRASAVQLARRGIEVIDVPRGGDMTYHGPGQLIGYPIMDLRPDRCDVHRYVRDLEEVLIRTVAALGVVASRVEGLTGVWVGNEKLAAIGVRLSRWVTSHGFALNVTTHLDDFDLIVPCGLAGRGVTSLERLLGAPPPRQELHDLIATQFGAVFDRRVEPTP